MLPITFGLAIALSLIMLTLTLLVSARRVTLGLAQGDMTLYPYQDGDDEQLKRRIRAFGNFVEYTPMVVILVGLMEWSGTQTVFLFWISVAFVLGRISHALGMFINPHFPLPRIMGMTATYVVLVTAAYELTSVLV